MTRGGGGGTEATDMDPKLTVETPTPPNRDLVAANLIEAGEKALVLNSGYFGDAFADCFEAYGIKADQLGAPVGGRPALADIEAALKKEKYAVLTFTHVDTCELPFPIYSIETSPLTVDWTAATGVLSDAKGIAEIVKRVR